MIKLKELLKEKEFINEKKYVQSAEDIKSEPRTWSALKYELRDQFDELVKIGADFSVFQNAKGTAKTLKQIKKLMDKI